MLSIDKKYFLALKATVDASNAIMDVYQRNYHKELKKDGSPVTEADLLSSKIIGEILKETEIPITGEERTKTPFHIRKNWKQHWCVDPLDGTKEFIKKNGEFVVSIALVEENQPVFGIIASPVLKNIILGGKAIGGAYNCTFETINTPDKWTKLQLIQAANNPLTIVSSRSHYSGDILTLKNKIERLYGTVQLKQMGSALKFFDLVSGKTDVYPRFAPTMEWDIAAGQAIYEAIGGQVIDSVTKKPLIYNKEELLNPHFIAFKKCLNL